MCKSATATACAGSEGLPQQQQQQASGEGGVGVGSSSTLDEAPVTEVQSGTLKNSAPLGEDIEEEEPGASSPMPPHPPLQLALHSIITCTRTRKTRIS